MNNKITKHAIKRMNQRHIPEIMILAVRAFGERIYARNSLYYFMGKRAVKRMLEVFIPEKPYDWEGLTLVCDPKTETLITVFKNKKWLKKIKHN
ncbi:MAG TPA: DUF4258 domain-containing protein [Calditrichaeota bacterium]|nr:DUF4258 domain-containing protein [Calditrichota bacterium]